MGYGETNLTKKIEKYWKKNGAYVLKFHGNVFTQQGIPDLIMCYKGHFIALEIKVNGNKPSPIQEAHIMRINEWYGGKAKCLNEFNWEEESLKIKSDIDKK